MTQIEDVVRDALRHLAGTGRPVSHGDLALAGATRRRRRRAIAAGGTALATTAAAIGFLLASLDTQPVGPAPPPKPTPSPEQPARIELPGAVVAGYTTDTTDLQVSYVLDAATDRYREIPHQLLAVAPGLDRAVVSRRVPGVDPSVENVQYGIYRVSTGTTQWLDIPEYVLDVKWSPDGRTVLFGVAIGLQPPQGYGWLVDRLVFVQASTGQTRQVAIDPVAGWEPTELFGWTTDGQAVALLADRVGTDEAPWAHILYDLGGTPIEAYEWSTQAGADRILGTDLIVLSPLDPGPVVVRNLTTGGVVSDYPADHVPWQPGDEVVGWLSADEIVLQRGSALFLANPQTGTLQHVANLPSLPSQRAWIDLVPVGHT